MRRSFGVLAAVFAVGAMGACGSDGGGSQAEPVKSTPATSSSVSESSTDSTSSAVPTSESETTATQQPAAVPTFVKCELADGTALMSDGSTIYLDSCNESAGGPLLLEDGTSIYDSLPPVNPDDVPIADGGNCPAARCGYGHDESGNPNPSSGEIQTKHGCDEGYITDPSLCGAVNEKFDW